MNNIFKTLLISGFSLAFFSCVPINELERNEDPGNYQTLQHVPVNSYPIHKNVNYYKAPDGAMYRKNDLYRDRFGKVYLNGLVIGQDPVFDHPGIIGRSENGVMINSGMLPPVDFDNNQYQSQDPKSPAKKRSASDKRINNDDTGFRK